MYMYKKIITIKQASYQALRRVEKFTWNSDKDIRTRMLGLPLKKNVVEIGFLSDTEKLN